MEKYNELTKCIKCGNTQATSYFIKKDLDLGEKEVMQRQCKNCGFMWFELPLDAKEE